MGVLEASRGQATPAMPLSAGTVREVKATHRRKDAQDRALGNGQTRAAQESRACLRKAWSLVPRLHSRGRERAQLHVGDPTRHTPERKESALQEEASRKTQHRPPTGWASLAETDAALRDGCPSGGLLTNHL